MRVLNSPQQVCWSLLASPNVKIHIDAYTVYLYTCIFIFNHLSCTNTFSIYRWLINICIWSRQQRNGAKEDEARRRENVAASFLAQEGLRPAELYLRLDAFALSLIKSSPRTVKNVLLSIFSYWERKEEIFGLRLKGFWSKSLLCC